MAGLAKLIERIPADAVSDLDIMFARVAEEEARRDGMGTISPRFAGRSYGPYPLTTSIDKARVRKASTSLIVFGHPAGFWTWLEDGIPRHEVGRSRRAVRSERESGRGGRFLAVSTPSGPRSYAHASMPTRGTWSRVVDRYADEVVDVLEAALDEVAA